MRKSERVYPASPERGYVCDGARLRKLRAPHPRRSLETDGLSQKSIMRAEQGEPVTFSTVKKLAAGLTKLRRVETHWDELLAQADRPHQVQENELYRSMAAAIQTEKPSLLRLSSFQPLNPQDPSRFEMRAYHDMLKSYLEQSGAQLFRIVAVHTLDKLEWLSQLVEQYGIGEGDGPSVGKARPRVSVRVLDCANDWEGTGRTVLPPIIQLIGRKVYLSDPLAPRGPQVPCVEVESDALTSFFGNYYDQLWATCKAGAILEDSLIQTRNLERIVFQRVSSYIQHLLDVSSPATSSDLSPMSPEELLKELKPTLELFGGYWYRAGLVAPGRRVYGRRRVAGNDHLEVVLMAWGREPCLPHDNGGISGVLKVLNGVARFREYSWHVSADGHGELALKGEAQKLGRGAAHSIEVDTVHSVEPLSKELVTLHVHAGPVQSMRVFDPKHERGAWVNAKGGAWWPEDAERVEGSSNFDMR